MRILKRLLKKINNRIAVIRIKKKPVHFENINKKIIAAYLPEKPVIIDCGAHIGRDSIQLAKIRGSQVYAFEPVSEVFFQLVQNTAKVRNIKCFNMALGSFSGQSEIFVSSGESDGSSSLLKPKTHLIDHPDVFFNESVPVKCETLDDWSLANGIKKIDLLWLDMQGYEMKMLKASPCMLKSVSVIHTEVSTKETYEGAEPYDDFKRFLLDQGFHVALEAIPEGYDMGNVLFVKK